MTSIEWFVIGGIVIAAADQIIERTPYKSNNIVQLLLTGLKAVFRVRKWLKSCGFFIFFITTTRATRIIVLQFRNLKKRWTMLF